MTVVGPITITEFVLARIAEDEAMAKAAMGHDKTWDGREDDGRWHRPNSPGEMDTCRVRGAGIEIYDEGGHDEDQAEHIAHHDPARVLAQCEAMRRIVELHCDGEHECSTYDRNGEVDRCSYVIRDDKCSTLCLLASIWSDHNDYREQWRP